MSQPYLKYQHYRKMSGGEPSLVTPSDIEGPFYLAGAPFRNQLAAICDLVIQGVVKDVHGHPVPEAVLDFWQADPMGFYDEKGYNFRGKVAVDLAGRYRLETTRPGDYKISDDEFRCAHVHVKVTAPKFKSLTTQLYFHDDVNNVTDRWFDLRRVIGPGGEFDFILEDEA